MSHHFPKMTDFYGYPDPLLLPAGALGQGGSDMGVYDHLIRPSMGHRMQVELRDSLQQYQNDKSSLQSQFKDLRFDSRDLYTSPLPPISPAHSIKKWGEGESTFGKAPNKAEKKARLAQLQRENDELSKKSEELEGASTLFPSVDRSDKSFHSDNVSTEHRQNTFMSSERDGEDNADRKNIRFGSNVELRTPSKHGAESSTKKTVAEKKAARKSALKDKSSNFMVKFPTIHSANQGRMQWDSGRHYLQRKGQSVQLEKSRVVAECDAFTQPSVIIPTITDPKRSEIRVSRAAPKPPHALTKVKFTSRQPKKATSLPALLSITNQSGTVRAGHNKQAASMNSLNNSETQLNNSGTLNKSGTLNGSTNDLSTHSGTQLSNSGTHLKSGTLNGSTNDLGTMPPSLTNSSSNFFDHFPQYGTRRFPELEELSTDNEDDEDKEVNKKGKRSVDESGKGENLELPPLPVVRLSESKLSKHNFSNKTWHMPRLNLEGGRVSPSIISETTGRSGVTAVTAATYMSQETLEWKEEYMTCADPERKSRILGEILTVVHQRMQDNQEELRLLGVETPQSETLGLNGDSGYNTDRSNATVIRLPKLKKKKKQQSPSTSKLQSYLHKMSSRRKGVEPRQKERVRFQLAHMSIREITQSTMDPRSTVHTAASGGTNKSIAAV